MGKFCLLVAIPCLRAPAKYDRFSVWCLNPVVILKIRPKSYFHEGRRMSAQRNFDSPPKNWGIYTRFAWAGGTFFQIMLLCQFSVLAGIRF